MILTGASPVTTFLAVLRLKCSDTPCGYQEHYRRFRKRSQTLPSPVLALDKSLPLEYTHNRQELVI